MLASLVVLAVLVASGAIVLRIVLLGDPEPATPPERATPRPREATNRPPGRPDRPWWRREGRYFVEILALCGFAVAQPVLGSFGDSPETFIAADASPRTIVAFGAAVVLLPALSLWAAAAATGLVGTRARQLAQAAAVGLLVGLLVSWSTRQLLRSPVVVVAVAVAAGLLAAVAYRRFTAARLYLTFASAAPVAFLVVFLVFSPVANLVSIPEAEAAAGAPSGEPSDQPSVVMVVLDELPTLSLLDGTNRIDAELFPNLARFAEDATFYRNHTTVATFTVIAMPAILTGRIPTDTAAMGGDYVRNLFTLLGDSHQLNVHEPLTSLCPPSQCERSFDPRAIGTLGSVAWNLWTTIVSSSPEGSTRKGVGEEAVEQFHHNFWDALFPRIDDRLDQMDAFLGSLEPEGARPRFDFAHVLFPHLPWDRVPSGRRYDGDPDPYRPLGLQYPQWTTETAAQLGRQRHLLQLQYTDQQVGRVLDRLVELDRYDDSYVIFLADHGISFGDQEYWRGVSPENADELLWVPLLIKAPGQKEGRITDVNAQTIDLVPTIADAMGMKIGWDVDGRSLLARASQPSREKRFVADPNQGAIQPDEGEFHATIDARRGLRDMLAAPPASAVPTDDPLALYRLPPHLDLTGTSVADLPHGPPAEGRARLVGGERYDQVDPEAATVPVYVRGEVEGADAELRDLVVAVNGVIGGWGRLEAYGDSEKNRFGVLVPESFLRPGTNTVEVFAMEGPPGEVTLRPVELVR
ncbi:MAG: sulfatase-like hydrolase/transferase [Actinobacteria bacterium]|nr:sulfatase-like hydrolase/transferase [Actinomycetota bacterium]